MKKVLMLLGGFFSFCAVLIANSGTGIFGGEEKLPDVLK